MNTVSKVKKYRTFFDYELDTYTRSFGSLVNEKDFDNFQNYLSIGFGDYFENMTNSLNIKVEQKNDMFYVYHSSKLFGIRFEILSERIFSETNCPIETKYDYYFVYNNRKPSLDTLIANKLYSSIIREFDMIKNTGINYNNLNTDVNKSLKIVFTIIDGELKFHCTEPITNKEFLEIIESKLKVILSNNDFQKINFARYEVLYSSR